MPAEKSSGLVPPAPPPRVTGPIWALVPRQPAWAMPIAYSGS